MRQSGWRWGGGAQYAAPAHWPRIHPPPPHPGLTSGPTPPPGHTSSPPTTARHPAPPTGHASPLPAPSSASRQAGRGAPRGVITARLEEGLANIVCEDLDRVWSLSQPPNSARKPETTTDGTGTTGRLQRSRVRRSASGRGGHGLGPGRTRPADRSESSRDPAWGGCARVRAGDQGAQSRRERGLGGPCTARTSGRSVFGSFRLQHVHRGPRMLT